MLATGENPMCLYTRAALRMKIGSACVKEARPILMALARSETGAFSEEMSITIGAGQQGRVSSDYSSRTSLNAKVLDVGNQQK